MHTKTDSDLTSLAPSSPPHTPPRRGPTSSAIYYVESPSQHEHDKMSYGSSPLGSPTRHYHCSPIHHSRESSSNSRFSSSLLKHHSRVGWRKMQGRRLGYDEEGEEKEEVEVEEEAVSVRFYVGCFLVWFGVLFGFFALVLWGVSKAFRPGILVKNMVFWEFNIQAGMDQTGVATDMLTLNSTVNINFKNPATFFGLHVTSTPFQLHYYNLILASGQMKKFYQKRKSHSNVHTVVHGHQIPLYGGIPFVSHATQHNNIYSNKVSVGLNLTFTVRSRAHILGKLVKSKFYRHVRCPVTLDGNRLGKSVSLVHSCIYD